MRLFSILLALVGFMATTAHANDIRWKSEQMTVGDNVSVKYSKDGLLLHVLRRKSLGSYVWDTYKGNKAEGKPTFTTYSDKDGNAKRWVRADGRKIRYAPHDCRRTLGQCSYKEIHSNGKSYSLTRITKATKDGFQFQTITQDGKVRLSGSFAIDARGMATNGTIEGYAGKQTYQMTRRSYQ